MEPEVITSQIHFCKQYERVYFYHSRAVGLLPSYKRNCFCSGNDGVSNPPLDNATVQSQQQEEQEGKQLLDDLSSNTVTCAQLNDVDFEKIGECAMGQSIGDNTRHLAKNEMMKRMMGEQGEAQMHTVMGKRYSGCDTSVTFPSQNAGFLPIMGMMRGGKSNSYAPPVRNNTMMNYGIGLSVAVDNRRHCWPY